MSNRMWGLDFLSRRGSNQLVEDETPTTRKSSKVQTLGSMRRKPGGSTVSVGSLGDDAYDAECPARSLNDQDTKPGKVETSSGRLSTDAPKTPAGAVAAAPNNSGGSSPGSDSSDSYVESPDKPSTSVVNSPAEPTADAAGPHNGTTDRTSPSMPIVTKASTTTTAAPADAASSGSTRATPAAGASPTSQQQQQPEDVRRSNDSSNSSTTYSNYQDSDRRSMVMPASHATPYPPPPPEQLQQQQQQPHDGGGMFAPLSNYTLPGNEVASAAQQGYGMGQYTTDASALLQGMGGPGLTMHAGPMSGPSAGMGDAGGLTPADPQALLMLLGDLQREAGLNEQQAAAAAALMSRYTAGASGINPAAPLPAFAGNWPSTPPTGPAGLGSNPFLAPGGPTPASFTAAAAGFGATASSPLAAMQHSSGLTGYDSSQNSSAANNVQLTKSSDGVGMSGIGFGILPGGLNSPEAIYGTDGLDVPGTAQVAVHNVPFKWCNADLEALFRQLPGYLDAQLLFHENGRSKGVGVALFTDAGSASEACGKLSGVQADGRKLELVLMSPDNHISFSCKQVAVLGLPWEYTASDVRALIEAAAEADGASANEAGVDAVEVAYRDDGKSEGRAIATFRSRAQAHAAITRLHGRETLAGLRMRLFYLHEQQQRQHLLAQTPQSLITSVGQLSLDTPSPAVAATLTLSGNQGSAAPGNNPGDGASTAAAVSAAGRVFSQQGSGLSSTGEGGANEAGEKQKQGEDGDGSGGASARSSFDKDQGPVILHVSGLMESVTREQLRELFSQAGEVTKVDIPDGGRSMGYGFITFSNPQAAEQAMLLFNNYPLSGGAIHVAYSTSATAKARQQALRQARKATLGSHATAAGSSAPRLSMEGRLSGTGGGLAGGSGSSGALNRPGGMSNLSSTGGFGTAGLGCGGLPGRRGGLGFDDPLGLSALSSGAGRGFDAMGRACPPSRHSFDHPGYTSPGLACGRPGSNLGSGFGVGAAGLSGTGTARRGSFGTGASPGVGGGFGAGLSMAQLHHLQVLQAAGVPGAAAALAAAAAAASTSASSSPFDGFAMDQLNQMMQMGGADPTGFGGLGGQCFGPTPGTPPHGGLGGSIFGSANRGAAGFLGNGVGAPNPVGLLGGGTAGAGGLFGAAGAGSAAGLLPGGVGAANPLAPTAGRSSEIVPPLSPFRSGLPSAAAGGAGVPRLPLPNRRVLVSGLPVGLEDAQVLQLFQICGPVERLSKTANEDVTLVVYESLEGASKAVQILDGTSMPSGRTMTVHYASEDLSPAGAAPDPSTSAPFGSGLNVFGPSGHRTSQSNAVAPAVGGWDGMGSGAIDPSAGMFGQGWGGGATRPAVGQGADANMFGGRGASWDGSGLGARPPMPGGAGMYSGGRAGLHGPSPLRSLSPASGIPSSLPSSASANRLPPVYMASHVSSFQGGAAPGGLFSRGVGASLSADSAPLLGPGDINPFGMSSSAFGYESAGAAVSEALLMLGEEAARQTQMQHGPGDIITGADVKWGSLNSAAGTGTAKDAAAVSMGMLSAWSDSSNWDGGLMNASASVGSNVVRQASPAPALSSRSSGTGSCGRLPAMGDHQGSDGGSVEGTA